MSGFACSSGKPPHTIAVSSWVGGIAVLISAKESVSSSAMSARPARDSETLFIKVNFCEPVSRELSVTCATGVDSCLEVAEEAGRVLHFVDNHGRRMPTEKAVWLSFGLFRLCGEIERDKVILWKES